MLGCGRRRCPGSLGAGECLGGCCPYKIWGRCGFGVLKDAVTLGGDPKQAGPQLPPKGPNGDLGNPSSHPTAEMWGVVWDESGSRWGLGCGEVLGSSWAGPAGQSGRVATLGESAGNIPKVWGQMGRGWGGSRQHWDEGG